MIAAIPTKYALHATQPALSKNAPAIKAMIGSFAPQGTKVVVIMVILRSLSFSMVREAITPGTPHPLPISIGMKDFPERPNLRKIRSMINATRAMYPQDSKNARKMNSTNICGTKPSTAPTPATTPSTIRPVSQSAQSECSQMQLCSSRNDPLTKECIICPVGKNATNCCNRYIIYNKHNNCKDR